MLNRPFSPNQFIGSCGSWRDFHMGVAALSESDRLEAFAKLVHLRLRTDPLYRNVIDPSDVWLSRDVPADVASQIRLPSGGVDIVARTRDGEFWVVRTVFVGEGDPAPGRRAVTNFNELAFRRCRGIAHALFVHSGDELPKVGSRTGQISLAGWQGLGKVGWDRIRAAASRLRVRPSPAKKPRPHQVKAVAKAMEHYRDNDRGRLIMPCGTGKSLTGFLIAEKLGSQTIVVAAPSIGLIKQNLGGWAEEFDARGRTFDCLCICSDQSVGARGRDETDDDPSGLGIEVTTDVDDVVARLRRPRNRPLVVFTTYHSSPRLAEAAEEAKFKFDLCLLDEAHKTVGTTDRAFATLLDEDRIEVGKRLFMTATERVYRGDRTDILSMDSETDYGKCFYQLSFKSAIEQKLICDYKLVTFFVEESEVRNLIANNEKIDLSHKGKKTFADADALSLAAGIALKSVIRDYDVKHIISFHRTIKTADNFRRQQDNLNRFPELGPAVTNLHISCEYSAADRDRIMENFATADRSCVSNARCLTEGIDVPNTDCVLFEGPRQSIVDVAQAAGRAMRLSAGKEYGYIVVPVVVPDDVPFEEFAESTEFRKVAQTLTAMSTMDERLAVEFRQIADGKPPSSGIVTIRSNSPVCLNMEFSKFAAAVRAKIWPSAVARTNWRPFEEARSFVRALGFKNTREWKEFAKSDRMPADIPNAVDRVYALSGWKDWGDWLGTGVVADKKKSWRPFEEARAFVRTLGLTNGKNGGGWRDYVRSGRKPDDIPSRPDVAYANDGWTTYGDWVGLKRKWRPFEEARAFVRELGIEDRDAWLAFAGSPMRPPDIPYNPRSTYANAGWNGWDDWLGVDRVPALKAPSARR